MTKKKKKITSVSPKRYLQSGRARKLPITDVLIPNDWMELGKFPVFIVREHINKKVTVANFLIDIWCCGIKDAHFKFNVHRDEFNLMVHQYGTATDIQFNSINYSLAHNIIYESLAYAEELGIEPHQDFDLVEYLLEEDDERIPQIDIPLGYEGQPLLLLSEYSTRNQYYIQQLEKHAGPGNYRVVDEDTFYSLEEDLDDSDAQFFEDWKKEDWMAFFEKDPYEFFQSYSPLVNFIFDRCVYIPGFAANQLAAGVDTKTSQFQITFDALEEDSFSRTEIKAIRQIHERIDRARDNRDWGKLLKDTTNAIKQWPENKQLHNYLSIVYKATGEYAKHEKQLHKMNKMFPDYLFGKISLGDLLLEQERFEDFETLFEHKYDLGSVYPEREVFHISEFVAFSQIMGIYFLSKDDLILANLYSKMIFQVMGDDIDESRLNPSFFNALFKKNLEAVVNLADDIKGDSKKIEEVAILLIT